MKTINPKLLHIVKGLPPVAKRGDKVSLDTEFFGMEKRRLHRPHGQFAYLGASFDGETVYYITDESQVTEFLNNLQDAVWIFANAKFDIRQLRRYSAIEPRKKLWDVILIEQIMYSGYYDSFALADLVRRYLGEYMPKEVREEFSETDTVREMTKDQIEYASGDVAYTWKVYSEQRKIISETDLSIWKEIELPFMWALLGMGGIRLDKEKWIALAKKNAETAQEIQDKYGHWETLERTGKRGQALKAKDAFVGINLNSPLQVKGKLIELGYKVDSTNAEFLESIQEDCEFARDMCIYRTYAKRSSTYGEQFVEDFVEADGKIYADIYQIGAETGRTSCRAPNLQNQPHETEYRECFIADDGRCIVVADWGSQEPKFAAYFSGDQGLIDALNSTEKLYVRVARDALHINITKDSPEYKHIKSTVLGIFYGMTAKGLSKRIGVDEETAQQYIDVILETYPGIEEYMKQQKRAKDYVTSLNGRKIWLNKYSNQWERNALNAPIQSSAAEAMKIAAARFIQSKKPDWELVLLVHDEIAIMVPEQDCEDAKTLLGDTMVSVANEMHKGIKGTVDIFSGSNWGCKH
jgi:DNA polymerase-1